MTASQYQKFKQLDEVGRTSLRVLALNNKYRGKSLKEVAVHEGLRLIITSLHDCASTTLREDSITTIVLNSKMAESEQRLWFFIELALLRKEKLETVKLAA